MGEFEPTTRTTTRIGLKASTGATGSPNDALPELLVLSAETESALEEATTCLGQTLVASDSPPLSALAHAMRLKSAPLKYRRMLVCTDPQDARDQLGDCNTKRVLNGRVDELPRSTVFMLPGVGDQYVGMAHGLYTTSETFRSTVDRCAELLKPYLKADIRDVLYPASGAWKRVAQPQGIDLKRMLGQGAAEPADPETIRLNTTLFSQTVLFTVEYSTVQLWLACGVVPDAIVGHSMGEYVAACLAGVLSLEDALRLIAVRARLVSELPQATMLAIMMPEAELVPLLPEDLSIALVNGPSHCVIAGPSDSVQPLETALQARGVICRRVQNGHAFHTRLMAQAAKQFEVEVRKAELGRPRIAYISNVTGTWITASQATDPDYWVAHLTRTARFNDALHEFWQLADPVMVECGPGRTLSVLAIQHPDRKGPPKAGICSIRQRYEHESDLKVFYTAVGKTWLAGAAIQWEQLPGERPSAASPDLHPPVRERSEASKPSDGSPRSGMPPANDPVSAQSAGDPANERERTLVALWQRALGRAHVGVNEGFGELGGDSLSAIGVLLEMKKVGVPDHVARGLYQGLTIRELVRQEAESDGGTQHSSANDGIELSSIQTPVFLRALGIFLVIASHVGLTALAGNPVLMAISGFSFSKFQLKTIAREQNLLPVLRFMARIAVPSLLFTSARQAWYHLFVPRSLLFLDNLAQPLPFGHHESPYYIDLLLQILLIVSVPLAIRPVREFALRRSFGYGMASLGLCWLASVIIPAVFDPRHAWAYVPQVYLWLFALGWCAAYSRTRREKIIVSATFVFLNTISLLMHTGLAWYMVLTGLTLIWVDELPLQIPTVLVRVINSLAGASLFIYLSNGLFQKLGEAVLTHVGGQWPRLAAMSLIAFIAAGGYALWRLWEALTRAVFRVQANRATTEPAPDPAVGAW